MRFSGTVQYLHGDMLGSVRFITNTTSGVIGTTEYDPYGNCTLHTGTADSALGFTGALSDPTTGMIYLRARIYDPATGGFLSIDAAVSLTAQPYAYTVNNPLLRVDPTGRDWWVPTTWSPSTWEIIGSVALAAGVIALAATGVGLVVDAAALGAAAAIEAGTVTTVAVEATSAIIVDSGVITASATTATVTVSSGLTSLASAAGTAAPLSRGRIQHGFLERSERRSDSHAS